MMWNIYIDIYIYISKVYVIKCKFYVKLNAYNTVLKILYYIE